MKPCLPKSVIWMRKWNFMDCLKKRTRLTTTWLLLQSHQKNKRTRFVTNSVLLQLHQKLTQSWDLSEFNAFIPNLDCTITCDNLCRQLWTTDWLSAMLEDNVSELAYIFLIASLGLFTCNVRPSLGLTDILITNKAKNTLETSLETKHNKSY